MTQSADIIRHNGGAPRWLPRNADIPTVAVPQKAFSTDTACDILSFAIANIKAGLQVGLCTLVEIRGGSSRPLGAHMAVAQDGRYCGYVHVARVSCRIPDFPPYQSQSLSGLADVLTEIIIR